MTGNDDWLDTSIAILAQRQQRFVAVAQGVGELNDLRHATEVLAEADAVAKSQVRLVEKAVIEVEIIGQWQVRNMPRAEQLDIVAVDANIVRRDLFVVADDDDFLGD